MGGGISSKARPACKLSVSVKDKSEQRILRHIANLASGDHDTAIRAEACLIRYYGARALAQLIDACDHPKPEVRYRAVWALAKTSDPRSYDTVLRLTGDPDEEVRYDATLALGKLGDTRAIQPLVAIAREDDVSRPAVDALMDFGLLAIDPYRALLREANPLVRLAATQGLGNIAMKHHSLECVAILKECLEDPDGRVRENARDWLDEELRELG